jgi:hypothetical protein
MPNEMSVAGRTATLICFTCRKLWSAVLLNPIEEAFDSPLDDEPRDYRYNAL